MITFKMTTNKLTLSKKSTQPALDAFGQVEELDASVAAEVKKQMERAGRQTRWTIGRQVTGREVRAKLKDDGASVPSQAPSKPVATETVAPTPARSSATGIKTRGKAKDGKPACLLCSKKFKALQQLIKHENGSKLHKKNLQLALETRAAEVHAKLAVRIDLSATASAVAAAQLPVVSATPKYRDRAKERRKIHNQDDNPVNFKSKHNWICGHCQVVNFASRMQCFSCMRTKNKDAVDMTADLINTTLTGGSGGEQAAAVDKHIDESNLGSKMLRGMGWQHGSGLGKFKHGITAPVNAMATAPSTKGSGIGTSSGFINVLATDSYMDAMKKKNFTRYNRS